jgi:predicted ATPase
MRFRGRLAVSRQVSDTVLLIKTLELRNFRIHEYLTCDFEDMNVFVGVNNSGKSTIIDAFRILVAALNFAFHHSPKRIELEDEVFLGYVIPAKLIPVDPAYIRTDFKDAESTELLFILNDGNQLRIIYPPSGNPCMEATSKNGSPETIREFTRIFLQLPSIVPTLGPLDDEENIVSEKQLRSHMDSRRASRVFRNVWFSCSDPNGEKFATFKAKVEQTWPSIEISALTRMGPKRLCMFYSESMLDRDLRVDREVAWAGFGFQAWLQLMTHLIVNDNTGVIVIDEPELYLHADLQRQLVTVLRSVGFQVILATHSVEIINEVEPNSLIMLERAKQPRRLNDFEQVTTVIEGLGSNQNTQLTRIARAGRLLFVEGKTDNLYKLLSELVLGTDVFLEDWMLVPLGGFSEWDRARHTSWAFHQILRQTVKTGLILDRDYRSHSHRSALIQELQKTSTFVHILERKELENYLLVPAAVRRAVQFRLAASNRADKYVSDKAIEDKLLEITEPMRSYVFGQTLAGRLQHNKGLGIDASTTAEECYDQFGEQWDAFDGRMSLVPGKRVLSELSKSISKQWQVSISAKSIAYNLEIDDVPLELQTILALLLDC